ncbi:hypothetical protein [Burkholderia gladioli]|uniref:hypothetical protein n=1 Tax=Burkholderia gladioli TaxID=28095 RepID=UPI0016421E62|nr:hypothetical protein [Burkholderia gladioli]
MDNILAVIGALSLIGIGIGAVCFSGLGALRKTGAPERQTPSRGRRVLVAAFRWGRNLAAMLGVCFAYLLIIGYFQYMDQVAQNDVLCAVSRCM